MTHYAWTIRANGRKDIQRVTTLEEMTETLHVLDLPGLMPADWAIEHAHGDGRFIHDEGGPDEWSITFTAVAFGPGEAH